MALVLASSAIVAEPEEKGSDDLTAHMPLGVRCRAAVTVPLKLPQPTDVLMAVGSYGEPAGSVSLVHLSASRGHTISSCPVAGDVTALVAPQFRGSLLLCAATAKGSVVVHRIAEPYVEEEPFTLEKVAQSNGWHEGAITGLAHDRLIMPDKLVSVGDDGRLNVFTVTETAPTHTWSANSHGGSSLEAVCVSSASSLFTVGRSRSQPCQLWDIRTQPKPQAVAFAEYVPRLWRFASFIPARSGKSAGGFVSCAMHPVLPLVACGREDGGVTIWDLRGTGQPLCSQVIHDGPVWDVQFVATRSSNVHLYTAGEDCTMRQWNFAVRPGVPATFSDGTQFGKFRDNVRIEEVLRSSLPLNAICVSRDGQSIFATSDNGVLHRVEAAL